MSGAAADGVVTATREDVIPSRPAEAEIRARQSGNAVVPAEPADCVRVWGPPQTVGAPVPLITSLALAGAAITRLAATNPADPIPASTCTPRMFPTQSL
jgi:hypothetical protein